MLRGQMFMVFNWIPRLIQGAPSSFAICQRRPVLILRCSQRVSWSSNRILTKRKSSLQCNVHIADFLVYQTELLDSFAEPRDVITDSSAAHKGAIGIGKANFTWSNEPTDGSVTPSRQAFRLRVDDELQFQRGGFNLIVGPTGSGKTSLLMALLGEMHYIPLGPDSWVNLPRQGGVAYATQESWVQNETIKVTLLFSCERV